MRGVKGFLEGSDEHVICSWLLVGFATHAFDELLPFEELPPREQIKSAYVTCSPATQERVKRAVVRAAAEWEPRTHPAHVLHEVAFLAADLRASAIVNVLRSIVEDERLPNDSSEELKSTMSTIIAVIGGFTGLSEAMSFLRRLYFSPDTSDIYRAQLLNALCEDSPDDYPVYLPRFIEAMENLEDYFVPELVFGKFVDVVSLDTIALTIGSLDHTVRSTLLEHIKPIFDEVRDTVSVQTRNVLAKYLPEPVLAASLRGRVTADNDYMLYEMDAQAIRADVDRANNRLQTTESLKEQLLTWFEGLVSSPRAVTAPSGA